MNFRVEMKKARHRALTPFLASFEDDLLNVEMKKARHRALTPYVLYYLANVERR